MAASTGALSFDVVPETLNRTNLGDLKPGDLVNLEPSLRAGDPLGGHLVYGHVDALTTIERKTPEGPGFRIWSTTPPRLADLICEKGFVALDGVSLTVASVKNGRFSVALIPETLRRTTFCEKGEGATLNVEADPLARYAASILRGAEGSQVK